MPKRTASELIREANQHLAVNRAIDEMEDKLHQIFAGDDLYPSVRKRIEGLQKALERYHTGDEDPDGGEPEVNK